MKTCTKCGATGDTKFYRNRAAKDGLQGHCKECIKARAKANYAADPSYQLEATKRWRVRNPAAYAAARLKQRAKKYGLTVTVLMQLESAAGGRCPICLAARRLVVDHCHATGRVRGLICSGCNTALGQLGDSADNASRAAAYLSRTLPG